MENSVKRKMNVFGKVAKIITTVLIVVLLVAEGFLLVGGIITAVVPKDSITVDAQVDGDVKVNTEFFGLDENQFYVKAGNTKIMLGDVAGDQLGIENRDGILSVKAGLNNLHFDLNDALRLLLCGMGYLAGIVVALFFFRALMKQFMLCDSPFSDGVVQKMRSFAIALIPCVIVAEGLKKLMGSFFTGQFGLDIDLIPVGFVLIIFVLTMIFRYGAMLQKEHDETV
ncbi:hypothetical protein [Ruminococcus sp.]|uniref:hypothetical protein n=1 Tax=Ruminococcus sp. TaxID=41978 RepID=UPI003890CDD7